jgi:hypothetical protein
VPPALAAELTRLLALTDADERSRRLADFWRHWFRLDREGVLAAIAGLPPGDERAQALLCTLPELAATEPDRAFELALLLARDASDAHLFSALFDLFARQDLARARERLARVPASPGFEPAWRAYADAHARADLADALRWAQGLKEGPARSLALETVLYTLSEKDPFAAFETALQTLSGEARDRSLYQSLMQIIPTDPAGAARLIVAMPASPSRELATVAAARAWAEDAPDRALAWAATLPRDAASSSALAVANILEIWARQDAPAAKSALATLPEGEARAAAAERVAALFARASPAQALEWAATLPDGPTQERALSGAVSAWARQDPSAAAAWTLATAPVPERGVLLAEVVSNWAVQDLPAAQRYVATLADTAAQTKAATVLISYLVRQDPLAALAWAEGLAQTSVRNETTLAAYREWLANDPAAARAWAASRPAPPTP